MHSWGRLSRYVGLLWCLSVWVPSASNRFIYDMFSIRGLTGQGMGGRGRNWEYIDDASLIWPDAAVVAVELPVQSPLGVDNTPLLCNTLCSFIHRHETQHLERVWWWQNNIGISLHQCQLFLGRGCNLCLIRCKWEVPFAAKCDTECHSPET